MELTIDQALQKAVEAHKSGKLQDAENLYRAILQAQSNHPDANHNLGVLAVSSNKSEASLPFFKTALEANPFQGQFWLSYLEALIKEKQFDNARSVLGQAKKSGLVGEKVDELVAKLTVSLLIQSSETSANNSSTFTQQRKKFSAKKEKKNKFLLNQKNLTNANSPTQDEVNTLLQHYKKGQYNRAQNLATILTEEYPNHPFGWKLLGALFKNNGELQNSVIANQRVIELSPNDADAHYNLGNTLKELGRLEEASTSYKKAIALKLDFPEAHCNLGSTLRELGRLEDAATSYKKAIGFKPDYADAHNNLGGTLKILGRLEDAELSYTKAIEIKPDFAEAILNRGMLSICLNNMADSIIFLTKTIEIDSGYLSLMASVKLAVLNFLEDDLYESQLLIQNSKEILKSKNKSVKHDVTYHILLESLIFWHRLTDYQSNNHFRKRLHVIGDSHALSSNRLSIENLKEGFLCKVHWIAGCKQWHLGNSSPNHYKEQFERVLRSLPCKAITLLSFGEIDCRLDDGIIKHLNKHPSKIQSALIKSTIEDYLMYLFKITNINSIDVIIQGVPCPNINSIKAKKIDLSIHVNFIKMFNYELSSQSKKIGFKYLDLHKLTDRGDGYSNGVWHIDKYHLSPAGMLEAWRRHFECELDILPVVGGSDTIKLS